MKRFAISLFIAGLVAAPALAQDTSPAQLIAGYEAASGTKADATRGRDLFMATHAGGKPDTPSCTTCHGMDLTKPGEGRSGKVIAPFAPSVTAARLTDTAKVEKWLGRNCNSVLGRECLPGEKADIVAWLATQ